VHACMPALLVPALAGLPGQTCQLTTAAHVPLQQAPTTKATICEADGVLAVQCTRGRAGARGDRQSLHGPDRGRQACRADHSGTVRQGCPTDGCKLQGARWVAAPLFDQEQRIGVLAVRAALPLGPEHPRCAAAMEKGFGYRDTEFHRVIPNFVLQARRPRRPGALRRAYAPAPESATAACRAETLSAAMGAPSDGRRPAGLPRPAVLRQAEAGIAPAPRARLPRCKASPTAARRAGQAAAASTGARLPMRASASRTRPSCCPWRTRGPTPTAARRARALQHAPGALLHAVFGDLFLLQAARPLLGQLGLRVGLGDALTCAPC